MSRDKINSTRFQRLSHFIEDGLLVTLLGSMICLAVSQIILRNFFGTGITWAAPLLGILVLWIGLAGSIVATRKNNHIAINVLSQYLPKKGRLLSETFIMLFTAIVSGIITWHSVRFVMSDYKFDVIAFESIPAWVCELIIPVAFGLMTLRYLAHSLDNFLQLKAKITSI